MQTTRRNDLDTTEASAADGFDQSPQEYQEVIALLQDEVTRLEQELQSYPDRSWGVLSVDVPAACDEVETTGTDLGVTADRSEIERLKSELAKRDETVTLLLDQLSLIEDAKAAGKAEWEQLTEWVAELEKRVEGQDQETLRQLHARVGDQERATEEWRTKAEQDRRGWEVERRVYEEEIARLHAGVALARAAAMAPRDRDGEIGAVTGAEVEVVKAVEQENLRLRVSQEMVERTAAENSNILHSKLGEMQHECEDLRHRLGQLDDERRRERLEYETTVAELRTKLSQAALVQSEALEPAAKPDRESEARDSELRIRALKQHLREIHEREDTERRERSLKHRLSRLWSRTSPP